MWARSMAQKIFQLATPPRKLDGNDGTISEAWHAAFGAPRRHQLCPFYHRHASTHLFSIRSISVGLGNRKALIGKGVFPIGILLGINGARVSDILYFCDETSQVDDTYMAIGGLALRKGRVQEVSDAILAINEECSVTSEVKWSTVKRRRVSVHKRYVDLFFQLLDERKIHFHIRFAPFKQYIHKESGPRGRTDTVSKMYYQMLLHRPISFYGPMMRMHIFPDHGDCTSYLPSMRNQLCAAGYRTKGAVANCVPLIETRDSKREPLLQLLDVPLGALAALRNERELGDVKAELAAHVFERTGWKDLSGNSPQGQARLNLWNAEPSR